MTKHEKILLMDDDEFFTDSLSQLLEQKGYKVFQASKIQIAEQILEEVWVHMIVVDLSMTSEVGDLSGLQIVDNPAYASIPKVILTANGKDPAVVRQTLRPKSNGISPVVDFIEKQQGGIDKTLIDTFDAHIHINWDLRIQWSSLAFASIITLAGLVVPDGDRASLPYRIDELEDLLRQVFVDSQLITIGRLLAYTGEIAWFEIFAQGKRGIERQYVVACGQKRHIQHQVEQYHKFVPQSSTVGTVKLINTVETLRFAATIYECIGGSLAEMKPLQELYLLRPVQDITVILEKLLGSTLASWHGQSRSTQQTATLKQFYQIWTQTYVPHLDQEQWAAKLGSLCNQAPVIRGFRLDCSPEHLTLYTSETAVESYPNPVRFLFDQDAVLNVPIVFGCVHSHLHLSDILVDLQGYTTWLIDFSQAHEGPILLDYIALEASFKTELLTMVNIETWCAIEKRLLAVNRLDEPITLYNDLGPEVQKVLKVISSIRERAMSVVNQDLRTYLAGLLIHSIAQLTQYDEKRTYIHRDLLPFLSNLISGAMICQYLTSPREFEPDFEDKSVVVEGKKISELTKQEWQLLEFLYEHAGQLCKFEDILKDVYEDAHDDIENGAWMKEFGRPKVNASIRRLRRKLEPNPQNSRYIITEREHGYKLYV